jgi:DNA-binding MarR family transcriptional regulator
VHNTIDANRIVHDGVLEDAMTTAMLHLDRQLCFAIYAAERAVVRAYRPLLEPLGLTYPQYLVLLVLWETDAQSVSALGERLALDSGTLTPLLKRLEAQGLVARARDPDDERVVRVTLTTAGKRLRAKAQCVPGEMYQRLGLPASELAELREALHALTRRVTAFDADEPGEGRDTDDDQPLHRPRQVDRGARRTRPERRRRPRSRADDAEVARR